MAEPHCPECETDFEGIRCPECGWIDSSAVEDRMVARASIPNLAALYAKGKRRGLIKPTQEYSNG